VSDLTHAKNFGYSIVSTRYRASQHTRAQTRGFSTYQGGFPRDADSPLERAGFEPPVPREGLATMVPSPRRLPHTISPLEESGFEPSVPLSHHRSWACCAKLWAPPGSASPVARLTSSSCCLEWRIPIARSLDVLGLTDWR
jgi:hypothetical protein